MNTDWTRKALSQSASHLQAHTLSWWQELRDVPWMQLGGVLMRRFSEARLGLSASSLTFTTVLALVPLFAVALALFAAFPLFGKFQDTVQRWLIESLIPESIARQVLGYLTQFARKANRLGVVGLVAVTLASLALMVTIERTLNQIWRVQRSRSLSQRVLLYWGAITLGPLFVGASLAITSYVVAASQDVADVLPGIVRWWLDSLEFLLLALCVSGLYFYVPNTRVRWRHALTAGLLAALGIELAKNGLTFYLASMPTYSAVYGTFAVLPILLIWIDVAWIMVLLGAVLAASLPELARHSWRQPAGPGWDFRLAIEVLSHLQEARADERGLEVRDLAHRMRVSSALLLPALEALQSLDWVGLLRDEGGADQSRLVILVDPAQTPLGPLVQALMLSAEAQPDRLWEALALAQRRLQDVLLPVRS